MRTRRAWPALLMVLPLLAVGCSDGDQPARSAGSAERPAGDTSGSGSDQTPRARDRRPDEADLPPDQPVGPTRTGKDAEKFGDKPVEHESDAKARLVDLTAEEGEPVAGGGHTEKVTFTFDGTEVLPKYNVGYVDAVRSHPEDDPIAMTGNAFLQVGFELTNPNVQGRLAIPPDLQPGLPVTKEVLVVRNIGGTMRIALGLDNRAVFRTDTLESPTRLVVELREKR